MFYATEDDDCEVDCTRRRTLLEVPVSTKVKAKQVQTQQAKKGKEEGRQGMNEYCNTGHKLTNPAT